MTTRHSRVGTPLRALVYFGDGEPAVLMVRCSCGFESSLNSGLEGFEVLAKTGRAELRLVCGECQAMLVADLADSVVRVPGRLLSWGAGALKASGRPEPPAGPHPA